MKANLVLPLAVLASFGAGILADRAFLGVVGLPSPGVGSESHSSSRPDIGAHGLPVSMASATPAGEAKAGDAEQPDDKEPASLDERIERLENDSSPAEFVRAAELVAALPPGERRRDQTARLASRWGAANPKAALVWSEGLTGVEQAVALEHIVESWAQSDPAAASDYVAALPNSSRSLDMVEHVASVWAGRDLQAAVAWGLAQGDPAVRERAVNGASGVWAAKEPAEAAAFAVTLEDGNERRAALEVVGSRWAGTAPEEALAWATSLAGNDLEHALGSILNRVSEDDPRRAAEIYEQIAPSLASGQGDDNPRRNLAREVASRWADFEPAEAAAWTLALPETGDLRRAATQVVAESWMRLDSWAASEWVATLPEGTTRDATVEAVVDHIGRSDHAAAFAWASSVDDEGRQTSLMRHVLVDWGAADPSAAQAALASAPVTPDQRERLESVMAKATLTKD